ncbi:hypothetical protein H109_06197 [Trichophyton interdigitale MR816]|uniref:aldehyde dehydrogenase (NAD(+)) n=1 Tax=Trichophyton interdigitale (strain MR816) TaxID=1215338 RepID=A0A059J2I1_TRIIM|nr:hypothetical protein H101_03772 [Trichophyton interdigitale H6]KDB21878.1 hypothetical protein H109_06197 [Trichophyton interdigitale MR816]
MDHLKLGYETVMNCTLTNLLTSAVLILPTLLVLKLLVSSLFSEDERPIAFDVPLPKELSPDWKGVAWEDISKDSREILISQGTTGTFSEKKILSYCPADGRLLGDENGIIPATAEDIDRAFKRASAAYLQWRETSFAQRRRVLRTLLKYILEHQNEIATACCLDSGKTKVDACFGDIMVTADKLKWTIDHGEKSLQTDRRPTNLLMMYKKNTVRYEPLGVVGACVSWNYPFHNLISPVISAIFAGNAIIVKPSEHTAWSSMFLCDIIQRAIVSCGHPKDLVQTVICLPQHADAMTSHPLLRHLIFIGSKPVAHEVCKSAAKALIPVTVELGGKDPAIILDDPKTKGDLPSIASIMMRAVFQSAGQNCIGTERIIALPNVYDELLDIVTPRIKALRLGSALLDGKGDLKAQKLPHTPDVGAQISSRSFDRLESLISEAVRDGARLIHGGKRYNHPDHPHGHYFMPTLLVDVTTEMKIAQTELFAPVFVMMRAKTVDEAISIANSIKYALGSSVFGHNRADVERCVSRLDAGMVAVNDFATFYAVGLPFGGVKDSGYGRFGGAEGLRNLSNLKAVCEDRTFIQTKIPPRLDYPIQKGQGKGEDGEVAWNMCQGVVETGYQPSLSGKISGVRKILGNM